MGGHSSDGGRAHPTIRPKSATYPETVFNSTTSWPVVMEHSPFHSTVCACDVNQHLRSGCRLDSAIETRHGEIILDRLLLAPGQNFLFRSGVPQLDCAITAPGRQPLPVGREGHRLDRVRMPFRVSNSWPVAASHSLTVRSAPPVASRFPSGEKATEHDSIRMPLEGEHLLAGGGVPQLDCAITAPGRQPLPVGREGH